MPQDSPDFSNIIAELGLPERFRNALASYVKKLLSSLAPECIILYGSLAKGTYTTASDIDLVVISKLLPENFLNRLSFLQELNDTNCGHSPQIERPEEFVKTVLDFFG